MKSVSYNASIGDELKITTTVRLSFRYLNLIAIRQPTSYLHRCSNIFRPFNATDVSKPTSYGCSKFYYYTTFYSFQGTGLFKVHYVNSF
jgi:hypothetical protein